MKRKVGTGALQSIMERGTPHNSGYVGRGYVRGAVSADQGIRALRYSSC
jgi:hypothetical protein